MATRCCIITASVEDRVPVALCTSTPRVTSRCTTLDASCLPWSEHTSSTSTADDHILEILSEVKKTNTKLVEYGVRLETLEQRMCSIEQKGCETPTCSSSCSDAVKTKVPPAVQVCYYVWTCGCMERECM